MRGCQYGKIYNPCKKDLYPLDYNQKHPSLWRFAEHINLMDERLRAVQSYYRQMRLVGKHFGRDPQRLRQASARGYIRHLKNERGWAPSNLLQAIAVMRMYHCEMLGRKWKL